MTATDALALQDEATFASIILAGAPGEDEIPPLLPCDLEPRRAPLKSWLPARIRLAVLHRDRWTCQLCGEPIDRQLRWPHPQSASVDHVLPRADGGDHRLRNLRAAHLLCNRIRGRSRMDEPA